MVKGPSSEAQQWWTWDLNTQPPDQCLNHKATTSVVPKPHVNTEYQDLTGDPGDVGVEWRTRYLIRCCIIAVTFHNLCNQIQDFNICWAKS